MTAKLNLSNLDDLVREYSAGASVNQLAKQCGVSRPALTRALVSAGVDLRSASEQERIKWQKVGTNRTAIVKQCGAAWEARRKTFTAKEGREIVAAYRSGVSIKGIVARLRASGRPGSPYRIRALLVSEGISIRSLKLSRPSSAMVRAEHVSMTKRELIAREALGEFAPQFPFGKYNIDFALDADRVAVEIEKEWPNSRTKGGQKLERLEYLIDCGWRVLYLIVQRLDTTPTEIRKHTDAFLEILRGDESPVGGCYGMVRCNAKKVSRRRRGFDHLPRVVGF